MSLAEAIGFLAGILTTIAFLPQLLQAWRTKATKDLSLGMFIVFSVGVLCWFIYGLLISSAPIILANGVTLVLSSAILFLKLRYG